MKRGKIINPRALSTKLDYVVGGLGSGNWGAMIQAEKGKEKNFSGFWANLELGVQIEIPNRWTKTTLVSPMGNGGRINSKSEVQGEWGGRNTWEFWASNQKEQ